MSSARSSKVLILTIGNGFNVLISFLSLPYLVRSLSYLEYGSFGQVLLVISIVQGLFSFNLNQVVNVFFADENYNRQDVFATLRRIVLFLSIGGGAVLIFLIPLFVSLFDNQMLERLIFLSVFNLIAQIPIPVFMSVLVFLEKVGKLTAVLVVSNVIKIILMFLSIRYFESVDMLMLGLSLVSVLQATSFYYLIPRGLRCFGRFDKVLSYKFFKMASPLTFSSFIERSLFYIDGVFISAILGTTAFAFYKAGAIEVPLIASLYGSVATIVLPEVARLYYNGNFTEIVRLKRSAISATVLLVYPVMVFLLFFADPLLNAYLSERYMQSIIVFSIFNLSLLIRVNDLQDMIIVSGNGRWLLAIVVLTTFLNIVFNLLFITNFGIAGGAISFILCLFIYAFFLTWKSLRIMHSHFRALFDVALIFKVLILSLILCLLLYICYRMVFPSFFFIIFSAPVYMAIILFLGYRFHLVDRGLFISVLDKFKILSFFK